MMEFFHLLVNNILYIRGVYPTELFTEVQKYGMSLFVTKDPQLRDYIAEFLQQTAVWVQQRRVEKLVVIISSQTTGETLERYAFGLELDQNAEAAESEPKSRAEIKEEQTRMQCIFRQIHSLEELLPALDETTDFELLAYASHDSAVPRSWALTDPRFIHGGMFGPIPLHSVATESHKVEGCVFHREELGA